MLFSAGSISGITFLAPSLDDALAIEQALAENRGELPAPIRFTDVEGFAQNGTSFRIDGLSKVSLQAESVLLHGEALDIQYTRYQLRKALVGVIVFVAFFVIASIVNALLLQHQPAETKGWWEALFVLLYVSFLYFGFVHIGNPVDRSTFIPYTFTYPRADLCGFDRWGNQFSLIFHTRKHEKRITYFDIFNERDADTIEAALCTQQTLHEPVTCPATGVALQAHEAIFRNYACGYLTVDDFSLTLAGKPAHSGLSLFGLRLPLTLTYAGCAYLLWALYPVLFHELIPAEYKGFMVLLVPLLLLVPIAMIIMGFAPLFTTTARSCLLREIAGLQPPRPPAHSLRPRPHAQSAEVRFLRAKRIGSGGDSAGVV